MKESTACWALLQGCVQPSAAAVSRLSLESIETFGCWAVLAEAATQLDAECTSADLVSLTAQAGTTGAGKQEPWCRRWCAKSSELPTVGTHRRGPGQGACLERHGSQKVCPQGSAKGFFLSGLADLQQHGSV